MDIVDLIKESNKRLLEEVESIGYAMELEYASNKITKKVPLDIADLSIFQMRKAISLARRLVLDTEASLRTGGYPAQLKMITQVRVIGALTHIATINMALNKTGG